VMNDDLIICTRNRPMDLSRCLESVARQVRIPDRIIVCDSSDGPDIAHLVQDLAADPLLGHRFTYLSAAPGLPRQRNLAIADSSGDVVHFIDDDVVLDPRYFKHIDEVFESDCGGTIGGVGGLITNLPDHRPRWILELLQLDSHRQGTVLRSGRNVLVFETDGLVEVDWLSGCSMSFRRVVFEDNEFNEKLVGYALGEDVDFTFRVGQACRLVVCGSARLQHLSSPVGRLQRKELVRKELLHRYWRVRDGIGNLSERAFWVSVGGQLAWLAYQAAARRSRYSAKEMWWTLLGILDIARSRL